MSAAQALRQRVLALLARLLPQKVVNAMLVQMVGILLARLMVRVWILPPAAKQLMQVQTSKAVLLDHQTLICMAHAPSALTVRMPLSLAWRIVMTSLLVTTQHTPPLAVQVDTHLVRLASTTHWGRTNSRTVSYAPRVGTPVGLDWRYALMCLRGSTRQMLMLTMKGPRPSLGALQEPTTHKVLQISPAVSRVLREPTLRSLAKAVAPQLVPASLFLPLLQLNSCRAL